MAAKGINGEPGSPGLPGLKGSKVNGTSSTDSWCYRILIETVIKHVNAIIKCSFLFQGEKGDKVGKKD